MRFIKKYIGELILLIGVWLFVFNIFNFSYEAPRTKGVLPELPKLTSEIVDSVAYYYSDSIIVLIALGAVLIVLGILIIRNKK